MTPAAMRSFLGASLIALGGLGCVVALFAMTDPGSVKLADDSAPFDEPPTEARLAVIAAVSASISVAGIVVLGSGRKSGR